MNPEHIYFNAFNLIPQIGPARFRKLINAFESLKTAWHASAAELTNAELEPPVIAKIIEARSEIKPQLEFLKLTDQGIQLLSILDDGYPKLLREIPNAPAFFLSTVTSSEGTGILDGGLRSMIP